MQAQGQGAYHLVGYIGKSCTPQRLCRRSPCRTFVLMAEGEERGFGARRFLTYSKILEKSPQ